MPKTSQSSDRSSASGRKTTSSDPTTPVARKHQMATAYPWPRVSVVSAPVAADAPAALFDMHPRR